MERLNRLDTNNKVGILKKSATELSHLVRTKQLSPVELVQMSISQIEKVNPSLNAMAENLFEQARILAQDLENKIFQSQVEIELPLLGVPVTVKEMFAMQGALRTAGSIHNKDKRMNFNSTLVDRILKAGAIPICTTNVPELGLWFETDNVIYGRTKNPYDLKRTSGGSTGGDAALIATACSPVGLGSDIGGSVRIPAAFCGVFGHKPTSRLLPKTGHYPSTLESMKSVTRKNDSITGMGFLARHAEDLPLMMDLLAGPDQIDQTIELDWKNLKHSANTLQKKIYVIEDPVIKRCKSVDDDCKQAVRKAADFFRSEGHIIEALDPQIFIDTFEVWSAVTGSTQTSTFQHKMTQGQTISLFTELFRHLIGNPRYTFPALVMCVLELFKDKKLAARGLEKAAKLGQKLDQILNDPLFASVILMPTHPRNAPRHQLPYVRPFDFCMTAAINPFESPATSVPMGLNKKGLPLSVQIVCGHNRDKVNFELAQKLEKKFGGWSDHFDLINSDGF